MALGAVVAMGSVLLVFQLGQPRIFFSLVLARLAKMARVSPREAILDPTLRHCALARQLRCDVET